MLDFLRGWRKRRLCFHHDHRRGVSHIVERIIDWRKLYRCTECDKVWII